MNTQLSGNILANRSSANRKPSDFYPTPPECTQALLDFLGLHKEYVIWEPACGEGHISEVLKFNGYQVISTDLHDRGYGDGIEDFLTSEGKECDMIITNPPFSHAEEFIRKCLSLGKPFALLLKSQYWHSAKRRDLFFEHKPAWVLPLTWRPDFEFGKRGGSPTMEAMWVVWDSMPCVDTSYIPLSKPGKEVS